MKDLEIETDLALRWMVDDSINLSEIEGFRVNDLTQVAFT